MEISIVKKQIKNEIEILNFLKGRLEILESLKMSTKADEAEIDGHNLEKDIYVSNDGSEINSTKDIRVVTNDIVTAVTNGLTKDSPFEVEGKDVSKAFFMEDLLEEKWEDIDKESIKRLVYNTLKYGYSVCVYEFEKSRESKNTKVDKIKVFNINEVLVDVKNDIKEASFLIYSEEWNEDDFYDYEVYDRNEQEETVLTFIGRIKRKGGLGLTKDDNFVIIKYIDESEILYTEELNIQRLPFFIMNGYPSSSILGDGITKILGRLEKDASVLNHMILTSMMSGNNDSTLVPRSCFNEKESISYLNKETFVTYDPRSGQIIPPTVSGVSQASLAILGQKKREISLVLDSDDKVSTSQSSRNVMASVRDMFIGNLKNQLEELLEFMARQFLVNAKINITPQEIKSLNENMSLDVMDSVGKVDLKIAIYNTFEKERQLDRLTSIAQNAPTFEKATGVDINKNILGNVFEKLGKRSLAREIVNGERKKELDIEQEKVGKKMNEIEMRKVQADISKTEAEVRKLSVEAESEASKIKSGNRMLDQKDRELTMKEIQERNNIDKKEYKGKDEFNENEELNNFSLGI